MLKNKEANELLYESLITVLGTDTTIAEDMKGNCKDLPIDDASEWYLRACLRPKQRIAQCCCCVDCYYGKGHTAECDARWQSDFTDGEKEDVPRFNAEPPAERKLPEEENGAHLVQ